MKQAEQRLHELEAEKERKAGMGGSQGNNSDFCLSPPGQHRVQQFIPCPKLRVSHFAQTNSDTSPASCTFDRLPKRSLRKPSKQQTSASWRRPCQKPRSAICRTRHRDHRFLVHVVVRQAQAGICHKAHVTMMFLYTGHIHLSSASGLPLHALCACSYCIIRAHPANVHDLLACLHHVRLLPHAHPEIPPRRVLPS